MFALQLRAALGEFLHGQPLWFRGQSPHDGGNEIFRQTRAAGLLFQMRLDEPQCALERLAHRARGQVLLSFRSCRGDGCSVERVCKPGLTFAAVHDSGSGFVAFRSPPEAPAWRASSCRARKRSVLTVPIGRPSSAAVSS